MVKIDGNLICAENIQLLKNNLISNLNEGEIFSISELHVIDRVQYNRVWLMKELPYWKTSQLRTLT